jgi:crotonobetainyl-CoA:carnitine CoA-transferase CaiB-like acyl-CoA transferase
MAEAALHGIRVVELGQGVSAPFCAKLLGDYGADVIKVEPPEGDIARRWGPFPHDQPHPETGGLFLFLNTNKRGITLDVGTRDGRERLYHLLRQADVFIENNRPQHMRDWGLDYPVLAQLNPQLVVISITPFGQTGPYAEWRGYDLNAFHLSASGSRYCGRPGEPPLEHGTFSADFFAGYVAAAWGLAAVYGHAHLGGGQHLDVSCAEVLAALFVGAQNIGGYAQDGKFEKRTGVGMPLGAPATILPCKDGYVWMMALEPGQWNGLRAAMGNPEWAELEMFQDMFVRAQNADMIYPLIEQWTMEHTKQEIMDLCQANGCPTTAVFTVAEVAEHPHLKERQFFVEIEHPILGSIRTMGAPIRLPESPGGPRRPAPLLGQHNAEVYGELRGTKSSGIPPVIPAEAGIQGAGTSPPRLDTRFRGYDGIEFVSPTAQSSSPTPPRGEGEKRALPLAGIRVANFGWGWLGPVVGQTLGFLGAEVYKIESRARLDINRTLPPFGGGIRDPDRSLQNHAGWAGNGSVSIDLKKPEGQELARELVARCDVVVENFGPGVIDKLHLSYEQLRAVKPDLIMASMPAAGLFGPLKDIRTYGMSLSSITGLDSITGYLGGPPVPVENAFADPLGGIIGTLGILLALSYRQRTGRGQRIDFSQQEGVVQLVAPAFMDYVMNRRVAAPVGNHHPLGVAAPHGVFPCAGDDRWISIAVMSEEEWRGLVRAMGSPESIQTDEFADAQQRRQHIEALHRRLSEWTRNFDDYALAAHLQACGVAAAPVLNVADLLNDPHFKARRTFIEVQHPLGFKETIYGAYVKTSGFEPAVRPGPMIGQDNEHVFKDLLEITAERYKELLEQKVIF